MALPLPPAGLNLTETRVPEILGVLISTWFLAAGVLILRTFARKLRGEQFWWDDHFAFAAFIVAGIHVWTSIAYMVPSGTGKHIWAAPPEAAKVWAIGVFVLEVFYTLTLCFVKYSTLCLYWRVFATGSRNRIPIWILAGLVTGWGIATMLASIFQCVPTQSWWKRFDPQNPMLPSEFSCGVDSRQFFIGNSIPTIITDVMIIALPVPYVWYLQMRVSQKIGVLAIFFLGAFVTIISMIRLTILLNVDLKSPDITWNFSDTVIWTNVECNIAVICCCLPTLKPVLNLVMDGAFAARLSSRKNTYGSSSSSSGRVSKGKRSGLRSHKKGGGGNDNDDDDKDDDLELQSGPGSYLDTGRLPTTVRGGEKQRPFAWLDDKSVKSSECSPRQSQQHLQLPQLHLSSSTNTTTMINQSSVSATPRAVSAGRNCRVRGMSRTRNHRSSVNSGSSTDELASPGALGGITVTHEVAVQTTEGSGIELKAKSVVPF